jgi:oligopeptide/dipeptide ABC transporter ATP-binding protein
MLKKEFPMKNNSTLLEVVDLCKYFPINGGIIRHKVAELKAVDGISFTMKKGENLGLVGESGCGKTTAGRCILGLYKATSGDVSFKGKYLSKLGSAEIRNMRQDMQMTFEDPYDSLDPHMHVGDIIAEPMIVHKLAAGKEVKKRVAELFRTVKLEPYMADRYAFQFSAGQRQRLELARALASNPSFIICDNPLSQLDVCIQVQIIDLLTQLKERLNLTYLFICHDLAVVRYICDRCMVMYVGKIMESASVDALFGNPLHPYTKAMLSAVFVPDPEIERRREMIVLSGETPSSITLPAGCRFHARCNNVTDTCREQEPELRDVGGEHYVACHRI